MTNKSTKEKADVLVEQVQLLAKSSKLMHDKVDKTNEWHGQQNSITMKLLIFIAICSLLTTSFLCLMLSTMSKNSVTPIIITISVVFIGSIISFIPLQIFENMNPYLFTGYLDLFLSSFHDPVPWNTIFISFGVCIFWSLFFLIIAFIIFNRKEILS